MNNQRENYFASKFHLLNSQDNSEEIVWSCSDSSDYEQKQNKTYEKTNKAFKRKRKRSSSKNNTVNISNLDITFIDAQKQNYCKQLLGGVQSFSNVTHKSPILTSQRYFKNTNKSPVINSFEENKPASPVLMLKHSPIVTTKVKKKLFNCNVNRRDRSVSPVLSIIKNKENNNHAIENNDKINHKETNEKLFTSETNAVLIDKVKSYFNSHFSSTTSQHSISEAETSKSSPKSNKDIEIVNSIPEDIPELKNIDKPSSTDSLNSNYVQKTKKVKYKKDGLANRLNILLKKQNASAALWYHERFLADNSNFILPKEDYTAYRIREVNFKYGCFLIQAFDADNENFLIYIQNVYVKNNAIEPEAVFKLYKPYKILDFEDNKLIINVCKYECIVLKK